MYNVSKYFMIASAIFSLIGEGGMVGSVRTDGKKSFDIALNDGYLRIKELQIAGKKRMDVESFLRGFKLSNEYKVK